MSTLTQSLLERGDQLAVYNGQLIITPKSGEPVPNHWLTMNSQKIITEIAKQQDQSIFTYSFYKTGIYFNGRSPGVMLRFADLLTGEDVFAIFNADLKRKRATKNKKAGEALPEGHFSIGDRSALYILWIKTDLDIPRRFSEWHKSMSKLKHIYFNAEKGLNGKLSNKSIKPLSISYSQIKQLFGDSVVTSQRQASDNLVIRNGDKKWRQELVTSSGDKHITPEQASNSLEPYPMCVSKQVRVFESAGEISACASNRVLSNQVMTCNVLPLTLSNKLPEEQSVDEWLHHYDSAS